MRFNCVRAVTGLCATGHSPPLPDLSDATGASKGFTEALMRTTVILILIIAALSLGAFAGGPPATYTKSCQSCHGADGNPSAMGQKMGAPAFSSADVQKMSDAQLTKAILTVEGHKKF